MIIGRAPDPADQPRGDPRHREDAEAERQERQRRGQRAEAEHALDVLHDQEEHRQLRADDQAIVASAADPAAVAQQGGWISGCA